MLNKELLLCSSEHEQFDGSLEIIIKDNKVHMFIEIPDLGINDNNPLAGDHYRFIPASDYVQNGDYTITIMFRSYNVYEVFSVNGRDASVYMTLSKTHHGPIDIDIFKCKVESRGATGSKWEDLHGQKYHIKKIS